MKERSKARNARVWVDARTTSFLPLSLSKQSHVNSSRADSCRFMSSLSL